MSDKLSNEISFTFGGDMWFHIWIQTSNKGIWRWQIRRPFSLERIDI